MTKFKKASILTVASAVALSSANIGMVFANENTDTKINISDFGVKLDGTVDGKGRVLVEFTIDKDIDLGIVSKDNIHINLKTNDGKLNKSKAKTWDGYLNAEDGTKYGSKNTKVPAGKYSSVFSYAELKDVALEDILVELTVTKNSESSKVTFPKQEDTVFEIKGFEVGTNAPEQALITFEINQTMDLSLSSKDNIKIEAIDPSTGQTITSKTKTWSGYLNDTNGNKYGMGSTLKPGIYQTVFSAEQIEYLNPSDIVIKLTATQDGIEYTKQRGEVEIKEINPVQVTDLKFEEIEDGKAIASFAIDQTLNLNLNTQDDLLVKVIEKSTGDVLTVKGKTWSNYLNNSAGTQFGRGEVVKSGVYSTQFTKDQLRGKSIEDLAIEIVAIQDGAQTKIATDNYSMVSGVKIENLQVSPNGEGAQIAFDIDQDLSLKLNSTDNVVIEAINKNTGDVLKKKDKTWTDYLNDKEGNQFGLNELVVAGTYASTFSKEQLQNTAIEDVVFRISVSQEGIKTSVTTGEFVEKEGVKIEELEANQTENKSISVDFTIDKDMDLGLLTKDNLTVELVNKHNGQAISSKGKLEKAYIVDEDGNVYGLGSKLKPGKYSVVFSGEEVGDTNIEDIEVIVTIIKDGIYTTGTIGSVELGGELPMPELDNVFGGSDRYETSVDVSVNGWESAENVVLVSGDAIIDGISATPFAGLKDAPILLTKRDSIPDSVKSEIKRLGAKNVYIIGGDSVVTSAVETQLSDMELNVERIGGKTRYQTSLNIAKAMEEIKDVNKAYIVGGEGSADGLSIGAVGAREGQEAPIVLVEKTKVDKETMEWLEKNIEEMDIIGGKSVVSEDVEKELSSMAKDESKVSRIAGTVRQETNAKIIETYYNGFEAAVVVKADNNGMVDGLTAGALAAKYDSPLIMVGNSLAASQEEVLAKNGAAQVYQAGKGVNQTVFQKIVQLLSAK